MIICKSEREIRYMREAGRVVAGALAEVAKAIRPGVTTAEINRVAEEYILAKGAKPAFKGLYGFPAAVCASVNEQVVHGIPGLKKLENGDIISIDVGAEINGFFGDAAQTFPVGEITPELQKIIDVTKEALDRGIKMARNGNRLSDISHAVQSFVEKNGYSVVRDYVGHGIGSKMHEDPQVPNFGRPGRGPRLKTGMTLAIEPMVNMGTYEVLTLPDNWTVVTRDGKPSVHFEHTIVITDGDPVILTML
ncbi:methionyl aminopeptidase [Desulfotomaculum arcticum]|uniref:Methionine aminopeptidase n=1 Tax=Desulfotruncus arcticus DSM 17038 TaxID=1121424 RepID=A0A1I2W728_9FIRM|nr:type I methionyl aminopeptidase [Desulfotruncus arcticus]SFG95311.1 methionyl aminopeptidase [Desulfotomaculum arcticum] [Desulfotruncus arcticus DSM 17038]